MIRILKPGKFHPQAVVTCEHCEAIIMVANNDCVKLLFDGDVIKYVFKCPECESQVMFDEDCFVPVAYPSTQEVV